MKSKFKIIAHRGASGYDFENSMSAFKKAIELKADVIETDVRKTKDDVLILSHDDSLQNLTNSNKIISESTFKELEFVKLNNGELIPTVEDLLSIHNGEIIFNLEIKVENAEELLVELVKKYDLLNHVVFSSFSLEVLMNIKEIEPRAQLQFVSIFPHIVFPERDQLKKLAELGIHALNPLYSLITEDLIKQARDVGLELYPWTINDMDTILKMIELGIDGIMTDYPDILNQTTIKVVNF